MLPLAVRNESRYKNVVLNHNCKKKKNAGAHVAGLLRHCRDHPETACEMNLLHKAEKGLMQYKAVS